MKTNHHKKISCTNMPYVCAHAQLAVVKWQNPTAVELYCQTLPANAKMI